MSDEALDRQGLDLERVGRGELVQPVLAVRFKLDEPQVSFELVLPPCNGQTSHTCPLQILFMEVLQVHVHEGGQFGVFGIFPDQWRGRLGKTLVRGHRPPLWAFIEEFAA